MKSVFLTGSSGVGKSTVLRELLGVGYTSSPNHLTRPPRPDEANGIDAIFVSEAEFAKNVLIGLYFEKTLEEAEHAGVYYGSPKSWVDKIAFGSEPLAATPSNVKIVGSLCLALKMIEARSELVWCNLYAPVDVRRSRIEHRVPDSEILHHRLYSGVSHGPQEGADIDVDTSLYTPREVFELVMEQTQNI